MSTLQHGDNRRGKRTPEYEAWAGMIARCHNPKNKLYPYYGARGIVVCDEWRGHSGYSNFLSHIGRRPSAGLSVDRIENDRGYQPGNVHWATRVQQMRNTRHNILISIDGRTQCLKAWADEFGVNYKRAHDRINRLGWRPLRALFAPARGCA